MPERPFDQSSAESSFRNLDTFLVEVETALDDYGRAMLFSGNQLGLDLLIPPVMKSQKRRWGLKPHQDWAFKATLLRFARRAEPTRLVVATTGGRTLTVKGWIVSHSHGRFWTIPSP